jgi:hypothetical protein
MHFESFIRQAAEMAETAGVGIVPLAVAGHTWLHGKLRSRCRYHARHVKPRHDKKV